MHNHEIVNASETRRQAELGIWVVIREGSACKDIEACLSVITEEGYHARAFQLCTDVITPDWMLERGQMDNAIRVAVQNGMDPMTAIQMSTIQPAEFYRVNHDMGMIAAGRYADIVFVDTLEGFEIDRVMANGRLWVDGGKLVEPLVNPDYPDWLYGTMNIDRTLEPGRLPHRGAGRRRRHGEGAVHQHARRLRWRHRARSRRSPSWAAMSRPTPKTGSTRSA